MQHKTLSNLVVALIAGMCVCLLFGLYFCIQALRTDGPESRTRILQTLMALAADLACVLACIGLVVFVKPT